MISAFAAAVTNLSAAAKSKSSRLRAKRCAWFVRRPIVPLPSAIGFIQTKSGDPPMLREVVFFVLSIRAEKALLPAKNLTPDDGHLNDLGLVQGLPLNAYPYYIQIVKSRKLAILSLSRLQ